MFISWENLGLAVVIIFKLVLGGAEESTGGPRFGFPFSVRDSNRDTSEYEAAILPSTSELYKILATRADL
jgi:hypothetical protein